jgi:hypothetical protein
LCPLLRPDRRLGRTILTRFSRQTLLGFISLQTGTEFISLMLVFNKLAGVYGILALITGFKLSLLQFSTYLYSTLTLIALAIVIPHIRKQSPLECLLLAWIYIVDTIINCACTTVFAVQWYLANTAEAQQAERASQPDASDVAAEAAMESANVRRQSDIYPRDAYVAMPQDTAFSIVLITAFTLVRIYFSFVVASYAQHVLVRYVDRQTENDRPQAKDMNGPFAVGADDGEGWRGSLGRAMLSVGRNYWLGYNGQDGWARSVSERLRKSSHSSTPSVV